MVDSRRTLVTGASGFVGSQVLESLLQRGFEVHAVARRAAENSAPDIHWHKADLLNPSETANLFRKIRPTDLMHFAWYAEHGKFWNSPLNSEWLSATEVLLKAFAENGGRRFVGAGSCAEYAWDGRDLYEENAPLQPATMYGQAKASAYLSGSSFAKAEGIEFAWGRIFHLFGPGEFPDRIVPALIRAHLSGQPLDCSQGTQLRDFLPVSDIAAAFAQLCTSGVQGAVNIGSGRAITLRELSEKISAIAGRKADIRFGAFHDSGPERLLPAVNRLVDEVGWTPPKSLDSGLEETIGWWKSQS